MFWDIVMMEDWSMDPCACLRPSWRLGQLFGLAHGDGYVGMEEIDSVERCASYTVWVEIRNIINLIDWLIVISGSQNCGVVVGDEILISLYDMQISLFWILWLVFSHSIITITIRDCSFLCEWANIQILFFLTGSKKYAVKARSTDFY